MLLTNVHVYKAAIDQCKAHYYHYYCGYGRISLPQQASKTGYTNAKT